MMQLQIHDNYGQRIGFINNEMPNALHYQNDQWHEYLAEASSTFEFTVLKNNPDYKLIQATGYLSFMSEDQDYFFRIITMKETDFDLTVTCGFMNLELTETVQPYTNTKKHSLLWYVADPSGPLGLINENYAQAIVIGTNAFPDKKDADENKPKYQRIINFDQKETKLARLLKICAEFGAEPEFLTDLYNDGSFHRMVVNFYDGEKPETRLGQMREDVTLVYGRNINSVTRSTDSSTIINAVRVYDSKKKYSLKNVIASVKNAQGVEEYFTRQANETAFAPLSKEIMPAQLKDPKKDLWVRQDFEIEAKSDKDLWDYALKMLKDYAYPRVTYTADTGAIYELSNDGNTMSIYPNDKTKPVDDSQLQYKTLIKPLHIGDTITIQDLNFDPDDNGLYLQARVVERITSFTDPSKNKYVFSNFVKMKSKINSALFDHMSNIIDNNTPYRGQIKTTNGFQLSGKDDSTTLIASVYKGTNTEETIPDRIVWKKDGVEIWEGSELTVAATDFTVKAVYSFEAYMDTKLIASNEVTVFTTEDGLPGRGLVSVSYKWMATSSQTAPTEPWTDSKWTENIPKLDNTNKYLWQMTNLHYNAAPLDEYSVVLSAVYGDQGDNGYFGFLSADSISIPTDFEGNNGNFATASTTMTVLKGGVDVTNDWSYTATTSTGVKGTLTGNTYKVSAMDDDTGFVNIVAHRPDNDSQAPDTIMKRYSLSKSKSGDIGKGVDHIVVAYAVGMDSENVPDGDPTIPNGAWSKTPPAVAPGQYLWTATIYYYSDETNSNPQYNISAPGQDGAGIKSTTVEYSNSTDLTVPTDWYKSLAELEAKRPTEPGMYLWTRTTIKYTNPNVADSVQYINSYQGKNGNDGKPGVDAVIGNLDNPMFILQADAEGIIDPSNGYDHTESKLTVSQGSNLLTPVDYIGGKVGVFNFSKSATDSFEIGLRMPLVSHPKIVGGDQINTFGLIRNNAEEEIIIKNQIGCRVNGAYTYKTLSNTVIPPDKQWHYVEHIHYAFEGTEWDASHKDDVTCYLYSPNSAIAKDIDIALPKVTLGSNLNGVNILRDNTFQESHALPNTNYGKGGATSTYKWFEETLDYKMDYDPGTFTIVLPVEQRGINISTLDIDPTNMCYNIGQLQNMSKEDSYATIIYSIEGHDYANNYFSFKMNQSINKSLNSYGGRIFYKYSSTNDISLNDMTESPNSTTKYMGVAVGSNLYPPTDKAAYIWDLYNSGEIIYAPTAPSNPVNGMRWVNNDKNSPDYNTQYVYTASTQTWNVDILSANNIYSDRIYSEGGEFKWIKSANYSSEKHIGTRINLETGEIELGSSAVDKDGNPVEGSPESLNRYLSWKDVILNKPTQLWGVDLSSDGNGPIVTPKTSSRGTINIQNNDILVAANNTTVVPSTTNDAEAFGFCFALNKYKFQSGDTVRIKATLSGNCRVTGYIINNDNKNTVLVPYTQLTNTPQVIDNTITMKVPADAGTSWTNPNGSFGIGFIIIRDVINSEVKIHDADMEIYINGQLYNSITQKSLIIGDVSSDKFLAMSPNRMSFFDADVEVMYITNQIMKINNQVVVQGLYVGQHKLEARGTHTVFTYTGGFD